jgi:hypothetical protein
MASPGHADLKALFIVPPLYEIDLVGTDIRPTTGQQGQSLHRGGCVEKGLWAG